MASIVIKDLSESAELDRIAMTRTAGGSSGLREPRSGGGGFIGRGKPIELSVPTVRTANERLRHSKCARA